MDLTAFLKARLDEDERDCFGVHERFCADCTCDYPLRILREVEAKRAILDLARTVLTVETRYEIYVGEKILRHLAAIYSDHPDYDPAWATS